MRRRGEAAWCASVRAYAALPQRNNTAWVVATDAVFLPRRTARSSPENLTQFFVDIS
ncbi:hypothetical protein BURMUCGD1_1056 [Burkholderia multivorans CGD1]|nr:hypothetical protein BURMUCGD1_1056 [Burkholderia multivorans CGD1]